jgi:glutamate-1-semialdehyde 2,1-aminomutase
MPIGAYGGRADVMNFAVLPDAGRQSIRQSGTHSAHPLSAVAGLAQLRELARLDPYAELGRLGARLRDGLAAAFAATAIDVRVAGLESICALHFAHPTEHYDFCVGLAAEGVYWAPLLAGYLSAAHTDADVDRVLDAAEAALVRMPAQGRG